MDISHRLTTIRAFRGITQDQTAAAMRKRGHKWHQKTVSHVEGNGDGRELRLSEAVDLADVLGVTLNQLVGIDPVDPF